MTDLHGWRLIGEIDCMVVDFLPPQPMKFARFDILPAEPFAAGQRQALAKKAETPAELRAGYAKALDGAIRALAAERGIPAYPDAFNELYRENPDLVGKYFDISLKGPYGPKDGDK